MKDNKTKEEILAEEKSTLKIKPNNYTNTKANEEFERKIQNIIYKNKLYSCEVDDFNRVSPSKEYLISFFRTHKNNYL